MLQLLYKDISPSAASAATPTYSGGTNQSFANLALLTSENNTPPLQTCEHNATLLDGRHRYFDAKARHFALWSAAQTRENGTFAAEQTLTFTFSGLQSSVGVTPVFATARNCYPVSLRLGWDRDSTLLADQTFTPDRADFPCVREVHQYNKLVLTCSALNYGGRFLKLERVIFGILREFGPSETEDARVHQAADTTGQTAPIHSLEATLNTADTVPFLFQKQQPVHLYWNGGLIGLYYLDTARQYAPRHFRLRAVDALGLLDSRDHFRGGVYTGETCAAVVSDICGGIVCEIDDSLKAVAVRGWLPVCSRRTALAQVALAVGGMLSTARTDGIRLTPLPTTVSSTLPPNLVYQTPTRESTPPYASVTLVEHNWAKGTETRQLFRQAFSGDQTVEFSEPAHTLTITGGTIVSSGANWAVLRGNGTSTETVLSGQRYVDSRVTRVKTDPLALQNDGYKTYTLDDATLVGSHNYAAVLDRLYNYYTKGGTVRGAGVSPEPASAGTAGVMSFIPGDIVNMALDRWGGSADVVLESLDLTFGYSRVRGEGVFHCAAD